MVRLRNVQTDARRLDRREEHRAARRRLEPAQRAVPAFLRDVPVVAEAADGLELGLVDQRGLDQVQGGLVAAEDNHLVALAAGLLDRGEGAQHLRRRREASERDVLAVEARRRDAGRLRAHLQALLQVVAERARVGN